jgi:uncharacterized protein (DUF342 family)
VQQVRAQPKGVGVLGTGHDAPHLSKTALVAGPAQDAPAMCVSSVANRALPSLAVSHDRLSVTLTFPAGCDVAGLSLGDLLVLAKERELPDGPMLRAGLHGAIAKAKATGELLLSMDMHEVVLRGQAPRASVDASLVLEHAQGVEAQSAAGDQTSSSDTRARSSLRIIRRGEVVARVRAAQAGEDGQDVRGASIAVKPATPLRVKLEPSVKLLRDGRVVALRDGALRSTDDELAVADCFEIASGVDFGTGNVDVPGDVHVAGGVADCFVVKASRDVVVHKLVDAATLEAGRDLTLHAGAAGRGQGRLLCGRDMVAPCLSGFAVRVGRNARVDRELAECELRVGGAFSGPSCAVVRGEVCATGGATVGTFGAASGATTTLVVGWHEQLDALATKLGDLRQRAGQAGDAGGKRIRELCMRDKLSASEAEELTDLSFRSMQQQPLLAKLLQAFRGLQERLATVCVPEVLVKQRIEAGATIVLAGTSGGVQAVFTQPVRGPVRIVGWRERGDMETAKRDHGPLIVDESTRIASPLANVARLSTWTRGANHEELCRAFGLELNVLLASFAMREAGKKEQEKSAAGVDRKQQRKAG